MFFLGLNGSPHKDGNSAFLLERFIETAKEHNQETARFDLNFMNITACQGCEACKLIWIFFAL
jgi:multimeric flavodoxin WrbA